MPEVRRILPTPRVQVVEDLPSPTEVMQVVANNNRWSRAIYDIKDVSGDVWCELCFDIAWHQEEKARVVHDFASVGIDFLTEDGSSIDFAYVPGLSRSQIDPHSSYIAGPAFYERSGGQSHASRVQFAFFIPAPTKHLTVTIRSWRNSHPFTISNLMILQSVQSLTDDQTTHPHIQVSRPMASASRRTWWDLSTTPRWQNYGIVPGHPLVVRGQVINRGAEGDGALVRVIFRDRQGKEMTPPYDDVQISPEVGAFIDIPVHRQTRRFTLELMPPPQAAAVELGFQAWRDEASISLVTPLEVAIGDDLLLENILGEENATQLSFLEEVCNRLGCLPSSAALKARGSLIDQFTDREGFAPLFTFHNRIRTIQKGEASVILDHRLVICGLEPWPIPEALEWTEDPYKSRAWRLEFQSLSWLLDLARSPDIDGFVRAADLALSWIESNPWGQPRDPLSGYPSSMATRAEVLLHLVAFGSTSKRDKGNKRQQKLFSEVIRYGFALAEILSQNVFSPSANQLRVACALLAISRAVPLFPLASHWKTVALAQLRSGFDQLIGHDGSFVEESLHYRLEILSTGLLLAHDLKDMPEAREFREFLEARLKVSLTTIVGVTDPAGMLPPFGDVLRGYHHASWLRRLISEYGRSLLSDQNLAEELSYPTGSRIFVSEEDGIAAFRIYEHTPHWSYLCASFGEQRHENGHFDCSTFVYSARGVRWITDPGGSSLHDTGSTRHYLTSSRAHNIAIPQGREQSSGCGWIEARESLNNANIIRIGTNVYGPSYTHVRTFICLDNLDAVAIFDRFGRLEASISFNGHLHFEENVAVALADSNLAIGFRNKSRLRITPHAISGHYSGMTIHNGCNNSPGALQGFVSHPSGGIRPANVLTYKFSGSGDVCGGIILSASEQGFRRLSDLLVENEVQKLLA